MNKGLSRVLSLAICLMMALLPLCGALAEAAAGSLVLTSNVYDLNDGSIVLKIGDNVTFGSYPQGAGSEVEPIEWEVLDIDEYGYYVLISTRALYGKKYDEEGVADWESCTLRAWLNGEFLNTAFNYDERTRIRTTHLVNSDNIYNATGTVSGGNETDDKVYLLSLDEIAQYFGVSAQEGGNHAETVCSPTDFAVNAGHVKISEGKCHWWLRSPGSDSGRAAYVNTGGNIMFGGEICNYPEPNIAVRPVIRARMPYAPAFSGKSEKGDIVSFGNYMQTKEGDTAPIEWEVLEAGDDGNYVLISLRALDAKVFNENEGAVWQDCSLRAWLNGEFYLSAFNSYEQSMIVSSHLTTAGNSENGGMGASETDDKVYLLSLEEIEQYYGISPQEGGNHAETVCGPTDYAIARGAVTADGHCHWWLRSPGSDADKTAYVNVGGNIFSGGESSSYAGTGIAVRPVIKVRKPYAQPLSSGSAIGDTVSFGNYPQGASGEMMPIEWTVLDIDEDGYFVLLSNYGLELQAYNNSFTAVTWEECSLRTWLNGGFFNTAFNPEERGRIKMTHLVNSGNSAYISAGGNDTDDQVYLLSLDEITQYFGIDWQYYTWHEELQCGLTGYAGGESGTTYWWWLRSPGAMNENQYNASAADEGGGVRYDGISVNYSAVAVRPVVRVSAPEIEANAAHDGDSTTELTAGEGAESGTTAQNGQIAVGDSVMFGNYFQGADSEIMPIEWTVIAVEEDGYYVLISKYGLDTMPYNQEQADVTWQICTLRAWLNGEFYDTAFNDQEKGMIQSVQLTNDANAEYATPVGNDTGDNVYLLSLDEVTRFYGITAENYWFIHDELCCRPTEYAAAKGAFLYDNTYYGDGEEYAAYNGNGFWWLRSPGSIQSNAAAVHGLGAVTTEGYGVNYENCLVRPVVRIKM